MGEAAAVGKTAVIGEAAADSSGGKDSRNRGGAVTKADSRGRKEQLRLRTAEAGKENRREPWNTRQSGILRIRDIVMP